MLEVGGVEAVELTNRKSGETVAFSLIALDPTDSLQYPPVSLFFVLCSWLRIVLGVQENSFDTRFFAIKDNC